MASIGGSVGKGGANARNDVTTVQQLINKSIYCIIPRAPLDVNGTCDSRMIEAILDYQKRVVKSANPDGRVDPGGRTLEALNTTASGKPYVPKPSGGSSTGTPGGKYTTSPNEVPTQRTTPTPLQVINMLLAKWPALNQTGARTLTAQSMAETGDWKHCYNWNLGNVKSGAGDQHMYLKGVWECYGNDSAAGAVSKAGGMAHIASDAEIKSHGWSCPGKTVVVFDPPHAQCRFRAYNGLDEGAQRWIGHHQNIATKNDKYLTALNAGDIATVAHILKATGYYTANETQYKNAMIAKKKSIDSSLGAP